jgi:hypothetical protein
MPRYASVYTPDGQFGAGTNATKGTAALKKMIDDLKTNRAEREKTEPQPAIPHGDEHGIELLGKDRARHHSYWQTVFAPTGRGAQPRVAAAGHGVDDLVKVNGKWLIKMRNVSPGDSD